MVDFETLNAFDYRYGLSARYTLPCLNTFENLSKVLSLGKTNKSKLFFGFSLAYSYLCSKLFG